MHSKHGVGGAVGLAILAGALAFAGCGKKTDETPKQPGEKTYAIAVIPKGTTHEYWKSVHAGAVKAQQELAAAGTKVELIWKGPYREDDRDQQIQVVENFTSRKVDGIVLAPLDSQALAPAADNAVAAGIPVVIIDSAIKSDKCLSFIATDNFKGGAMAGDFLAKLLNEKGNVIMLRYAVGSASTEAREKGFMAEMEKFPNIKLVSTDQYAGATQETAYQASQNLLNRFGNDLDGVFCPAEPITIAMTKAVRDIGKAGGKVKIVGFDAGTKSVEDLKNGDVQALTLQNPVLMGYDAVMSLARHFKGEKVESRIDTGAVIVTRENMDQPANKDLLYPPLEKYLK